MKTIKVTKPSKYLFFSCIILNLFLLFIFFSQGCGSSKGTAYYCDLTNTVKVKKTIDEFIHSGEEEASLFGIAADSKGTIYAAGASLISSERSSWFIRKSSDRGNNWETIDQFGDGDDAFARHITIDQEKNIIFVPGQNGNYLDHEWVVRKGTNNGTTWETTDSFILENGTISSAFQTIKAVENTYYTVGYAKNDTWISHLVVRKTTDEGKTWETVQDFSYSEFNDTEGYGIAVDSKGTLFISGTINEVNGDIWLVGKLTGGGSTWETVSEYQSSAGYTSQATSIAINSKDEIFVAGIGYASNGMAHWIVRKSNDGGSSWRTVDKFQLPSGRTAEPNKIKVDYLDNVYAIGYAIENSLAARVLIRQSSDGGEHWSTLESYLYKETESVQGTDLNFDTEGNLIYGGYAMDGGKQYWLARMINCEY